MVAQDEVGGYTAVTIDDYPSFNVDPLADWQAVHLEDGHGWAELFWFKDASLDEEGYPYCKDCLMDDGSPVPMDLFHATSHAWGDALFYLLKDRYDKWDEI